MSAESDALEVLSLEYFAADCRVLDAPAFRAKHGDGFLLHEGPLEAARRPQRPQSTVVLGRAVIAPDQLPSPSHAPPPIVVRKTIVFPVRHTGRSPFPRIVTVGRTRNNDIIISDIAISKFHAFFKEEDGHFFVQDAGSRNGTFVDTMTVSDAKHGKPALVKSGANVRFGEVSLTFADSAHLRNLVLKPVR